MRVQVRRCDVVLHMLKYDDGSVVCTCVCSDSSYYKGSFRKGKRHGQGNLVSAVGTVYEGQWKFDKRHGLGTYTMVHILHAQTK